MVLDCFFGTSPFSSRFESKETLSCGKHFSLKTQIIVNYINDGTELGK